MSVNRRDKKLDALLGKVVEITFFNGEIATGVLEFNRPYWGLKFGSNQYSIPYNGTYLFFRKSHVKSIRAL